MFFLFSVSSALGDCVAIIENAVFVILNEVKNLMHSVRYTTQILSANASELTLRHSLLVVSMFNHCGFDFPHLAA